VAASVEAMQGFVHRRRSLTVQAKDDGSFPDPIDGMSKGEQSRRHRSLSPRRKWVQNVQRLNCASPHEHPSEYPVRKQLCLFPILPAPSRLVTDDGETGPSSSRSTTEEETSEVRGLRDQYPSRGDPDYSSDYYMSTASSQSSGLPYDDTNNVYTFDDDDDDHYQDAAMTTNEPPDPANHDQEDQDQRIGIRPVRVPSSSLREPDDPDELAALAIPGPPLRLAAAQVDAPDSLVIEWIRSLEGALRLEEDEVLSSMIRSSGGPLKTDGVSCNSRLLQTPSKPVGVTSRELDVALGSARGRATTDRALDHKTTVNSSSNTVTEPFQVERKQHVAFPSDGAKYSTVSAKKSEGSQQHVFRNANAHRKTPPPPPVSQKSSSIVIDVFVAAVHLGETSDDDSNKPGSGVLVDSSVYEGDQDDVDSVFDFGPSLPVVEDFDPLPPEPVRLPGSAKLKRLIERYERLSMGESDRMNERYNRPEVPTESVPTSTHHLISSKHFRKTVARQEKEEELYSSFQKVSKTAATRRNNRTATDDHNPKIDRADDREIQDRHHEDPKQPMEDRVTIETEEDSSSTRGFFWRTIPPPHQHHDGSLPLVDSSTSTTTGNRESSSAFDDDEVIDKILGYPHYHHSVDAGESRPPIPGRWRRRFL
jgi:hypothetical protein